MGLADEAFAEQAALHEERVAAERARWEKVVRGLVEALEMGMRVVSALSHTLEDTSLWSRAVDNVAAADVPVDFLARMDAALSAAREQVGR